MKCELTINGVLHELDVEPRRTLADVIREDIGLTGTHLGCEHGVCGACTVLLDGEAARACLAFAVQLDGARIDTVEGLADASGALHPLQAAMCEHHGLQCGYCTAGMLMTAIDLLGQNPHPTRDEIRVAMSGNICRCTGYVGIVDAIEAVAEQGVAVRPPSA